MTPKLQKLKQAGPTKMAPGVNSESIVISGMSGIFPMSESIKDFTGILYNKINPVTSENSRWKCSHPEGSDYTGKVPGLERFDSHFFMVHNRLGNYMDPMARKVLEQSYQAIYDAGLSPNHLHGKKIGVFIATAFSETEKHFYSDIKSTYKLMGSSKSMFANRISYWLNLTGPSLTLDDACCGSMVALENAHSAISSGICEAAIVGGTSLCLFPHTQVHYSRCMKLSPADETRSFDENANGCTMSEAISVLFLQKAKNALRAYAEVVQVKNEFTSNLSGETGQAYGFLRNPERSAAFMEQFYKKANISPLVVEYVEAYGTANPEADKAELQAIEKVFCENRPDPLSVGSVISNVGFTGPASGVTAVTKVLLGFHHSLMASNLHCTAPRQDIAAIREGRMCVVTEHQPFRGSYAAVNCLSITGVNSHVLLRGCTEPKDSSRYQASIPRLVTLSARQEAHLKTIFDQLKSDPIDAEQLALLLNIHSTNISGHLGRGYIILDTDPLDQQKTVSLFEKTEHFDEMHRPLWFVYSGMGSQWAGMGAQLMRIPVFATAIERCQKVLEPEGIDIVHIITSADNATFDNVLNSFLGIAAIQIGLTDILFALELRPDKIIGHSVGEFGCAYADGCLSTEEIILSAYNRGKATIDTPLIRGAMAAVGVGYRQLSKLCPPAIDIACHNGPGSCTISGPEQNVLEFVSNMKDNGVFAKIVPTSNIAYHSRYIADAAPNLSSLLTESIWEPRARSERWLSTSVPQERWHEPLAKYCSPEYFTNNFLNSVLFEETIRLVPSDAVLVEIAPHGLLQAILKRSLPDTCINIPLTQRGHEDNALFLLNAIGKLYVEGFTPQLQAIYPKVEFPVSTGTPHLSHYVKWNHADTWMVLGLNDSYIKTSSSCEFLICTHDDEHSYLKGNVIQGKVLYPFAGALVAVWDTLAMTLGLPKKSISVRFQEVYLFSQPILHDQKQLNLNVSLQRGNGQFQVLDGDSKVATGYITTIDETNEYETKICNEKFVINSDDLYEHLRSRGYFYREEFRSIHSTDEHFTIAQLIWNDNWVTLIDGLVQLNALSYNHEEVTQLTHIRDLNIDVKKHQESLQEILLDGKTFLNGVVDKVLDSTRCGGVALRYLKSRNLPSSTQETFELKSPTLSLNEVHIAEHEKPWKNNSETVALQIGRVGNLDTLYWDEIPRLSEGGVKVMVKYAGINMSDVKRATGVIPFEDTEKYFGMDFSGLTKRGDRVMGLVRSGGASSVVSVRPELLWPVPAHWTLEEAATVPLAYIQAYYCLCIKSELQSGWSVLIHGAVGALGQAAVSMALARGCRVFATVADCAKKRFLLRLFPQLNEDAIGNSRDHTFGDMVLNATSGEGCNIVISCVQENLKNISLKCTAITGVTVDTVQIQNRDIFDYGMFNMASYIAVDFYSIFDTGNHAEINKLQTLVSEGIALGHVRPLSRVTCSPHEAPRAFRLLAASRHRGRVLLRMASAVSADPPARAQPRINCSPNKSHLIVWDGSPFGLQLADRLVTRGARKLRILDANPTSLQLLKIRLWQKMGVDVKVIDGEKLNERNAVSALVYETSQCGPIEGIFVTSVTLNSKRNNELIQMIDDLDISARTLCPQLKYFAVITVDSDFGKQTCMSRFRDGFAATLLDLSACVNSKPGATAEEYFWNRSAVDVAEQALRQNNPVVSAQPKETEKLSLSTLVAALSGNGNEDCKLQDLGISESLPYIKSFLRDVYHLSLDDEDILKLTKKKISEMEMNLSERDYEEVNGLHKFISYVDHDELRATAELIPLSTLYDVKTLDDGSDDSKAKLFIIPGLEGHSERFRAMCLRLKLHALVLQPGLDHPDQTPQELATRYSKVLLENFKLKSNFYLLGYECGIFAALELAAILEDHGLTGTVFCLGDGPGEVQAALEAEALTFGSEEALQEGVARHMSTLLARSGPAASLDCSSHSAQYTRAVVEAAYARIAAARRYSAAPRALRSRLVLLRARLARDADGAECSLQRYTRRALAAVHLAAPAPHAAADLQVPAVVNRYLDDDVLKTYENSNLCETYLYTPKQQH